MVLLVVAALSGCTSRWRRSNLGRRRRRRKSDVAAESFRDDGNDGYDEYYRY